MHLDLALAAVAAAVGVLVGLTGTGGGALMTPVLVMFFGVPAASAIACDLVASAAMRPVGAAVHLRRGTADLPTAAWLTLGSVPFAILGSVVLRRLGSGTLDGAGVQVVLGAALLLGAMAVVARHRSGPGGVRFGTAGEPAASVPHASGPPASPMPARMMVVGAVGGFLVGLTSVGAGSLMIVLLAWCAPNLKASRLVGTDLVQAVPLTCAAAVGQLVFGHVVGPTTVALVAGGVPGSLAGAALSSRVPDQVLRPVLGAVLALSGLRCLGAGAGDAGWVVAGAVSVLGSLMWARRRGPVLTAGGHPSRGRSDKAQSERRRNTMPVRGFGLK